MIPLYENKKVISGLKEKWVEELFFQKIQWENLQEELKELRKYKSLQKEKEQIYTLNQELLRCRDPSPSYPIFLFEQMTMFKMSVLKEGKPCQIMTTPQFLETFTQSDFFEQKLLCELYLHEMACIMDPLSNYVVHLGDIHLRAPTSFVTNHMHNGILLTPFTRMRIVPLCGFTVNLRPFCP